MPMRLFRFSRFFRTRKAGARTGAIISLVVVLPQLPVMPTTGTGKAAAPGLGQVAQGREGVVVRR